jgi:hypothetical protein
MKSFFVKLRTELCPSILWKTISDFGRFDITNPFFTILARRTSDLQEKHSDVNQEFVSEDYDTSAVNMDDIRREIEQLSSTKKSSNNPNLSSSPGNHLLISVFI